MKDIRLSLGTAAVAGLCEVAMDAAPTTAYLMLGERCRLDCAFCAQARSSSADAALLSRVHWPRFPPDRVLLHLARAFEKGAFRRCCIQVTAGDDYHRRTLEWVRALREHGCLPLDVAIVPANLKQVEELLRAGVEHVGFGLDAACERIFEKVKGPGWNRRMALLEQAARRFPGHIAVHLIVGLGEREREMAEMMQRMHDLGVVVGLFAFTPVRGTRMEATPPPPLSAYRRLQAARYLITHGYARAGQFSYDEEGRITALSPSHWRAILSHGDAFRTSGCPHCNRPYYNERPGGPLYNYPRPLRPQEAAQALRETGLCQTGT